MEKHSIPSLQITDRFGAQTAYASLRLPDGTEATVPAEHAAAIYVNEQPAFRVVCTPALLPQLALGRLLTEGWIASADEVEQIAVCAEGAKVQVYLRHPLPTRRAAAQEVASCCTDNIALGSPVEQQPLRPVPGLALQPEWVERLTAAMHAGLPLYRATRAVHSCFVLHKGEIVLPVRIWDGTTRWIRPWAARCWQGCRWRNVCCTPAAGCRWIWCARPSAPGCRCW